MPPLILVIGEFYAGQLISFTQKRDWLENTKKQLRKTFSSGAFGGGPPPYFWTKLRPEGPIKFWGGGPPSPRAHFIRVNRAAAMHLTPSQTPVIAVDQPLFTLAKEIECRLIGAYEEDSFLYLAGFT